MNRFESYCNTVLGLQVVYDREKLRQDQAIAKLRIYFGDTFNDLSSTAMGIARKTPLVQPDVFWALVTVLDWVQQDPLRLRDLDAAQIVNDACNVLQQASSVNDGFGLLNQWLMLLDTSRRSDKSPILSREHTVLVAEKYLCQQEDQKGMTDAQRTEAEGLLAEFKGCHERVISVLPLEPLGFVIVTETGKEFQVNGALAIPLRKLSRQGVTND